MTFEQRKIALISWIANLEEEEVVDKIEAFRNQPKQSYAEEITQLLEQSDSALEEECIDHTNVRGLLKRS